MTIYYEPSCAQDAFDDHEREKNLIAQGMCPHCLGEYSTTLGYCIDCGWKQEEA